MWGEMLLDVGRDVVGVGRDDVDVWRDDVQREEFLNPTHMTLEEESMTHEEEI